jgi:hypothetical protein
MKPEMSFAEKFDYINDYIKVIIHSRNHHSFCQPKKIIQGAGLTSIMIVLFLSITREVLRAEISA